jgi:hypothetical protein
MLAIAVPDWPHHVGLEWRLSMGCGVLVVSPESHDIAELLRSAGHRVVQCAPPADHSSGRGLIEEAWLVLTGLDLLVIVEQGAAADDLTGDVCDRARELMIDRGPGGLIVWVPPDVPASAAVASILDLTDSGVVEPGHCLEVEAVPPRLDPLPVSRPGRLRVVRVGDQR